jgi:cell division protein ZapD
MRGTSPQHAIAQGNPVPQNSGVMENPEPIARQHADKDPLAFEQPLNERMRMFLRVEFLYRQALFHASDATDFGTRAAVSSLLEILTITTRSDVRAELLKELDRHVQLLGQYRFTPNVDADRLNRLMGDIDARRSQLTAAGKNFITGLKGNEFLATIKHRSVIPGGTCGFDLPDYGYWLHGPRGERAEQLDKWLGQLKPLCEGVAEVLWLIRESSEPAHCVAVGGLYQHSLGRADQGNLVRVLLPSAAGLFPEISAGQRGFTVRFAEWRGVDQRPRRVSDDVRFKLAVC